MNYFNISSSVFLLVLPVLALMHVLFAEILDLYDSDDSVEDSVPTHKHRRICNEEALQLSLSSGRYPEYWVLRDHVIAIIHRQVLWPESLCDLI